MDPDNPVKALYIEFLKGYYTDFDLTFDQLLLMLANRILQHQMGVAIKFPEGKIKIDEVVATVKKRCEELHLRAGGSFG